MKNFNVFACASMLFFVFDCLKGSSQNQLSGTITDNTTHLPLSRVSLYIPEIKRGVITGTDGKYLIKNIPAGNYLALVSVTGYASQTKDLVMKGSATADFSLTPAGIELPAVIVTGVSTATELRKTPAAISVVTQKDLLQNSATNIIDAISNTPGISQMTLGLNISKPFVCGLGYNRVVTINDGVRHEGQQWFDEFGEKIDEFSVNKIEIVKGHASLSYGSDAMAGVINMIAASPLPEGQIKANILANYQFNSSLFAKSANLAGNKKGFVWDVRYSNKLAHCYQNKYDGYVANSGYLESNAKVLLGINRQWGYSYLTLSSFDLNMGIIEGARDSATGKFLQHFLIPGPDDSLGIAPESGFKKYNNLPVIHQHIRHYKAILDNVFAIGSGRLTSCNL